MTEYEYAETQVEQWDLGTLMQFAVDNLAEWYEANPCAFTESLKEWESDNG